jgi:hypothetical protein
MSDQWGNKGPDEMVRDAEAMAAANEPLVEDAIQSNIWAKNPASKFKNITKDMALANLGQKELEDLREWGDMASELRDIGFTKDAQFFQEKIDILCVSSLAKNGFAHRLLTTSTKELEFRGNMTGTGQKKNFWKDLNFWKKF